MFDTLSQFPGGSPDRLAPAADLLAGQAARQNLVELTKLFGGKVLDLTNDTITVELSAKGSRVDSFLKLGSPHLPPCISRVRADWFMPTNLE